MLDVDTFVATSLNFLGVFNFFSLLLVKYGLHSFQFLITVNFLGVGKGGMKTMINVLKNCRDIICIK